ncbi:MAG: hypothetical protein ACOC3G_07405, partial [Phycisphaeraceae bacterium]
MPRRLTWLLHLLFWPRRVAARANHWSWPMAWGVHAAGLVMGMVLMFPLMIYIDETTWDELIKQHVAVETIAGLSFAFVLLEACYVLAGAWTSSWGAGDEKCSQSVLHALKRHWALTPHMVVVSVAFAWCAWWYSQAVDPWNEWWMLWMFGAWAGYLAVLYYALGMTLAVLSAGRSSERTRWPAGCEGCNYALMNLGFDEHCPECGLEVWKSLDHRVRVGLWDKRRGRVPMSLWCFLHPRKCGAAARLFDPR